MLLLPAALSTALSAIFLPGDLGIIHF